MMSFLSYTTLTVLTVNLLATSGDITMTWSSPMLPKLHSNDTSINPLRRPITNDEDAYIASLINIGALFGGIPFSYISERYGRKNSLLVIGFFHMVAYIALAVAKNVYIFYFGRFFGGLAVGGGYTILPMYIAEIADESNTGIYSMTLTIFWAVGNFLPYCIGPFVNSMVFNLINTGFPTLFFIMFFCIGKETPFYLVGANKMEEATKVLMTLRSKDELGVQVELKHIKDTLEQEAESSTNLKIIFNNKGIRKAFIVSISLISFTQLCGWGSITFYLQLIFEASGTWIPADISALIVGAFILLFSLPTPYFADKFGRKKLLLFSIILTGICLICLGVFFYIENKTIYNTDSISWLPITSLLLMAFAFESGMACLPWTIPAEIFPKNLKKVSATTTSIAGWLTSFLVTEFFNDMNEGLGTDGTFFLFSGFCFLFALFTIFYVPETKNKTFTEIQEMLRK